MRQLRRTLLATAALGAALAPSALAVPAGYTRVFTPAIPVLQNGTDAGGQISCPAGTVPWGGGVGFSGGTSEVGQDINTSAPTADGWRGRYNNRNGRTTNFVVSAVCAAQPRKYTVAFAQGPNLAGTIATVTATCPANTVVLGGGNLSTSTDARAYLISTYPSSQTSWTAVEFNGSTRDENLVAFAICARKPKGYDLRADTTSGDGPATFLGGTHCRPGRIQISGGLRVTTPLSSIALGGGVVDEDTQWFYELNVGATGPVETTGYSICVK
jgi:hypothetical protein